MNDDWIEGYKDENHYLTAEGYPLGTTCWYVRASAGGMIKFHCAATIEEARQLASAWVEEMKKAEPGKP